MTRVARFFATHGARAAPLAAGVPALSQLSRVLENASGALASHPALAETAVRVALSNSTGSSRRTTQRAFATLAEPHSRPRFPSNSPS